MHFNRAQTKNFGEISNDIRRRAEQSKSHRGRSNASNQNGERIRTHSPGDAAQQTNSRPVKTTKSRYTQHETANQSKQPIDIRSCSFCGGKFHQRLASCPARYHQCDKCLNIHHFEQFCRSPRRERPSHNRQVNSGILKQQTKSYHSTKPKERTNVIIVEKSDSESDD